MKPFMNRFLYALFSALLCAFPWLVFAGENDGDLTVRDRNVVQDGKVADDGDAKNAESVKVIKYGNEKWLKITSTLFVNPKGYEFRKFTFGEKLDKSISYDFVDINGSDASSSIGVVVGTDGAPIVGPHQIKVFSLVVPANDAGRFPLQAEGNLQDIHSSPATGPGNPETPELHSWRAKVKDERKGYLKISCIPRYVPRTSPSTLNGGIVSIDVEAIDESGVAQKDVVVQLSLKTDKGPLTPDPFRQQTTRDPIIDLGGPPIPEAYFSELPLPKLPTNQAQATKYVATATATNYAAGSIEIPIYDGKWVERDNHEYQGFDPISDPPWLVVGMGNALKSQASTLKLDSAFMPNQVALAVNNGGLASMSPTPHATSDSTDTDVTGTAKGETYAAAKSGQNEIAKMNIAVKKTRTVKVHFAFAKDEAGHDGSLSNAEVNSLLADSIELWKTQAVVDLQFSEAKFWTVSGNFNDQPTQSAIDGKLAAPGAPQTPANEITVVVFWDYTLTHPNAAAYTNLPGTVVIKKGVDPMTVAHEIGHALGHTGHSPEEENLMAGHGVASFKRVRKYQADIVNP